jgi:hypothetical protein
VTPSLTPTSTLTPSPTPSPTPDKPQIIAFTASAASVTGNSTITLAWETIADSARIDQLNKQGGVVQPFSIALKGSLQVVVPGNQGSLVVYRLVAIRGGQEVTKSLPITIQCPIAWFFGNEFAPPGAGCPTAVGAVGTGAFQPFEHGFMIYVNADNINSIYGLVTQDSRYISYKNAWDGSSQTGSSPPSGRFAPQQMFNWAYFNTNAPIGSWANVLGWATGNIDTGSRTIQYEQGTGGFYIDSPVGVFRLSGTNTTGLTWQRIK